MHYYKFRYHKNGFTNWEGNSNRTIALKKDTVLAPVCFGNINGICTPKPAPSTVTFKVDLSNEVPDPNGKIYVRANPGIAHKNGPWIDIYPWDFDTAYKIANTYNCELSSFKKDNGDRLYFELRKLP
jgi:hypothetical protein